MIELEYKTLGDLELIESGLQAVGYPEVSWRVRGLCRISVAAEEEAAMRATLRAQGLVP